jgi:hypothetical protein
MVGALVAEAILKRRLWEGSRVEPHRIPLLAHCWHAPLSLVVVLAGEEYGRCAIYGGSLVIFSG